MNKNKLATYKTQAKVLFRKYRVLAFVVAVVLTYGYVFLQVNQLSAAMPTDDQQASELKSIRSGQINADVVKKLTDLRDNSIEVQALFDQARDNPFQDSDAN